LLLHLKRFIVEEKRVYATENEGNENRPPNSPAKPISVDYICKKDNARVKMPLSLTLDPFHSENTDDLLSKAEETRAACLPGKDYSLKSVVYHTGTRASSGHYFADALRQEVVDEDSAPRAGQDSGEASGAAPTKKKTQDAWYCFDDTNSSRHASFEAVTQSRFRQENAYMLLYSLNDNSVEECATSGANATVCAKAASSPIRKAVEESKAAGATWAATSVIAKGGPVETQTAGADSKVEAASSAATLSKTLGAIPGCKLEDSTSVVEDEAFVSLDNAKEVEPEGLAPTEHHAGGVSGDAVVAERPFGANNDAEQCKSKDPDSVTTTKCEPTGANNSVKEKVSETVVANEPTDAPSAAAAAAEESKLESMGSKSTVEESKSADTSGAVGAAKSSGATSAAEENKSDETASEALGADAAFRDSAKEIKRDDTACTSEKSKPKAVGIEDGEPFGAHSPKIKAAN